MTSTPTTRPWRHAAGMLTLLAALLAPGAQAGSTLDAVRSRGQLICGVSTGLPGFAATDANGKWQGLDVDICRAVAAAVLGDADKVRYAPLSGTNRFSALQAGEIDLLSHTTTITLARDAAMGLHMTGISYYDAQGFLVPVKSRLRSARQLKDKTVCVQQNSTTVRNLNEYSRLYKLNIKVLLFDQLEAANAAYFAGKCDAFTNDMSQLAVVRTTYAAKPDDHVVLPDVIAKEPLGPMVKRGDEDWTTIVRWVLYGLIEAEEQGITQANVDRLRSSPEPAIQRIAGTGEDLGKMLGLDREWLARAIRATGNYGEIFDRNLGAKSLIGVPRGLNHLWNRGGLHYALPVR